MKKLFFTVLATAFLFGCDKEDDTNPTGTTPQPVHTKAKIDGTDWAADSSYAYYYNTGGNNYFVIGGKNKSYGLEVYAWQMDTLNIAQYPGKSLNSDAFVYQFTDSANYMWYAYPPTYGTVSVNFTKVDTVAKLVSGIYTIHAKERPGFIYDPQFKPGIGDRNITSGTFTDLPFRKK